MKAHETMTRDPVTASPADTIAHAARLMRDGNVGMLPVVETDGLGTLVGVITDRDITVRCVAEEHRGRCRVRRSCREAPGASAGTTEGIVAGGRWRIHRVTAAEEVRKPAGAGAQA